MASKDIQIRIDAAVDAAGAAKSLGQLKRALLDVQELQSEIGDTSDANFSKLGDASVLASQKLAQTRDAIGDIQDRTKTLEGTSVERLTGSFGLLKDAVLNLDFDKAKIGAEGLLNTFTPVVDGKLVTGFSGIKGAVGGLGEGMKGLGSTFMSLGKALLTNPIFLLATVIVAIVAGVAALLNSLGLLKPILDGIKAVIGFIVDAFQALTDWLGLTTNAQNEYAAQTIEDGEKIKKSIEEQGKQREELYNITKDLTEEEIKLIEEKLGVEIDANKNIFDLKKERLKDTNEQTKKEIDALKAIVAAGGELDEEQQKQLDERRKSYKENANEIKKIEAEKQVAIVNFNNNTEKTLRDFKLRNIKDEKDRARETLKIREEEELSKINAAIREGKRLGQDVSGLYKAKNEIVKFYNSEETKIDEAAEKERADKRKEAADKYVENINKQLKALQDAEKLKVISTKEGTQERLDAEISSIQKVEEFQEKNAKALKLSKDQLAIIEKENLDKVEKLTTTYNDKVKAQDDATNAKKEEERQIQLAKEEEQYQLLLELQSTAQEKEVMEVAKKYDEKLLLAQGNAELEKELLEAQNAEVAEINKRYEAEAQARKDDDLEKDKARNKKSFDETIKISKMGFDAAQGFSDAIFAFKNRNLKKGSAEELKAAKQQFKVNKALAIASGLTNTGLAVTAALTAGGNPIKLATGIQFVEAALAGTIGLANVAKIAATKFDGGGAASAGGAPTPSVGGGGGGEAAPQFTPTQFFGLGQGKVDEKSGGFGAQKVYVTEGDIKKTMKNVEVIENRAKIG